MKYNQAGFFEKHWRLVGGSPEKAYVERDAHGVFFAVSCNQKDITTGRDQTAALKIIPIDEASLHLSSSMPREDRAKRLHNELARVKNEIDAMRPLHSVSNVASFLDWTVVSRKDTSLPSWDVLILMHRMVSLQSYRERNPHTQKSGAQVSMALQIWKDIISAMVVCEKIPIIHANIKPTSVTYQPVHDIFMLTNFGVSIPAAKFKPGICCGTREYMSPEMYERKGGDGRTDIYSTAVMIYELLNGDRLPLQEGLDSSDRAQAWERRLRDRAPIPPIEGIPLDINQVLLKCLEVEPDRRYASWKELDSEVLNLYVEYKKYSGSEEPLSNERKLKFPQPGMRILPAAERSGNPKEGKKTDWLKFVIIGIAVVVVAMIALIVCLVASSGPEDEGTTIAAAAVSVEETSPPTLELSLEDAQLVAGAQDAAVQGRVSVSGEIAPEQLEVTINGAVVEARWEERQDGLHFVASPGAAAQSAGSLEVSVRVAGVPAVEPAKATLAVVAPEPEETELPPSAFAPIQIEHAEALNEQTFGSNNLPQDISGSAQPGAEVKLYINDAEAASAVAGEDGRFELGLSCVEGENDIQLRYGQEGAPEGVNLRFWLDTQAPVLSAATQIDQYATELEVQVEDQDERCRVALLLDGQSARTVSANGGVAKLTRLGELNFGAAGEVAIEATDRAGNVGRITIEYKPQATQEPRYVFKSAPVEAAVCEMLGKERGTLRASDLLGVNQLSIEGGEAVNLADMKQMTNLIELHIENAEVSNLSALEGLQRLQKLELSGAGIDDIAPLAGMTGLTSLDLSGNNITDLTPLMGLTELTSLTLADNAISDVRPLASLSGLEELYISNNRISNAAPLEGLKSLRVLWLDGNPLDELPNTAARELKADVTPASTEEGSAGTTLSSTPAVERTPIMNLFPTLEPTDAPALESTEKPMGAITPEPTLEPKVVPTLAQTNKPTSEPTATPTPAATHPTLQRSGENDREAVFELQRELIERNYLDDVADGAFGQKTEAAVKLVQQDAGFEQTGIADEPTWAALLRMERDFEPDKGNRLLMYGAEYDASEGMMLVYFKNMGSNTVTGFEFTEYQCNSSKKHIGDFGGHRDDGNYSYYSTYQKTNDSIAPGETSVYRIVNFYDGYQGKYSDGESYTMRFFDDGAYAEFTLTRYTTIDSASHAADYAKSIYASIR